MTEASVPLGDLDEDEQERARLGGVLFSGRAVEVYDNGLTASTTDYLDGVEHGLQRIWRRDGSLESECTLVRGQAVGRTWDDVYGSSAGGATSAAGR